METKPNDSVHPVSGNQFNDAESGLPKREYFAAMAMQGIIGLQPKGIEKTGETAVLLADNLIEALNKFAPLEAIGISNKSQPERDLES